MGADAPIFRSKTMEREIKEEIELLNREGCITNEGWARHPYWRYDREKAKGSLKSIKEWDYYEVTDNDNRLAFALTFSDLGYAAVYTVAFVDLEKKKFSELSVVKKHSKHKTGLYYTPDRDNGITMSSDEKDFTFSVIKKGSVRRIIGMFPRFKLPDGRLGFKIDIALHEAKNTESVNIATSWKENRKCFHYNEKLNPMKAEGLIWLSNDKLSLGSRAYGVLDWARGRWTKENTWHWGSVNGSHDGILWGINLGYGFTDRSPASENAIIFDGRVNKLREVEFDYPDDMLSRPWLIKDNEGRLFMELKPLVNRKSSYRKRLSHIVSDQNQVFGSFNGWFILDDGRKIEFSDLYGFAERVYSKS